MAVMSFLDAELDEASKAQREQQDIALRDRRAEGAALNPVVGSVLHGASMGFSDEATAGVRSLFGPVTYDEALKQERAGGAKFSAEHPVTDFALQAGGSVLPTLAGARLLRGRAPTRVGAPGEAPPPADPIAGATTTTPGFSPLAGPRTVRPPPALPLPPPPATTIGPSVANAAKLGAIEGGVQGFGEGEGGVGNRAVGGVIGGGVGGVVGGGVTGILHGAQQALKYPLPGMIRAWNPAAAERGALDKVNQNLARDGTSAEATALSLADQQAGRADLLGAGFPSSRTTLGEMMGPSTTTAIDAAAQSPGSGGAAIRRDLTDRASARGARTMQGLQASFGDLEDAYTAKQRLWRERSADSAPLFQTTWDNAWPVEPIDLQNLRHVPRAAFDTARQLARMEGRDVSFEPRFDADGFLIPPARGEVLPSVEDMHHIKVGLGNYIESNIKDGRPNSLAVGAMRVRDSLTSRIEQLTTGPDGVNHYRRALDAWADPTTQIAALRLGKDAANKSGAELQHEISRMSEPDRAAFASGFFTDLRERLAKVDLTGTANPVRAVFRDEKQRTAAYTALSALGIGTEEANARMARLTDFFEHEMAGSRTETTVLRGSQTAQRQQWLKDLAIPAVGVGAGSASYLHGDDPVTAASVGLGAAGVGAVSRLARQGISRMGTERTNDAMMRMLGLTDPGAQNAAMAALAERATATRRAAGMGTSGLAAGGVAGAQAGPRVASGTGLPGLMFPPPIDDQRFQPQ